MQAYRPLQWIEKTFSVVCHSCEMTHEIVAASHSGKYHFLFEHECLQPETAADGADAGDP